MEKTEEFKGKLPPELSSEHYEIYRYFLLKAQENLQSMKITEEVGKLISEDYVEARKSDPSLCSESLQLWIIIGKSLSAMSGLTELGFSQYLRAKDLESQRTKRLSLKKC